MDIVALVGKDTLSKRDPKAITVIQASTEEKCLRKIYSDIQGITVLRDTLEMMRVPLDEEPRAWRE